MTALQLRAWPHRVGNAAWWSGAAAALLALVLLVSLHAVLRRTLEQGELSRAIQATQVSAARHCTTLVGVRVQESCLLALNEAARVGAESALAEPIARIQTSN